MRSMMKFRLLTALTAALLGTMAVNAAEPPQVPETPADVKKVLYAEPFVLDEEMQYLWCEETPMIEAGYLLVLEVDPDLVYPRQTYEPVLYVGKQTAQRVNHGHKSGRVIAIAPAKLDEQGKIDLDLAKTRIWFGTPALPEQVSARQAVQEHALATKAGIQPRSAAEIQQAASEARGQTTAFADGHALMTRAGELVKRFSPQDKEVYERLLMPESD